MGGRDAFASLRHPAMTKMKMCMDCKRLPIRVPFERYIAPDEIMRLATYVLMGVNALLWGSLALVGGLWLRGMTPNRGQVVYYFVYPSVVLMLALLFPIW